MQSFPYGPVANGSGVILIRKGFPNEVISLISLILSPVSAVFSIFGTIAGKRKIEFSVTNKLKQPTNRHVIKQ